MNKLLLGLIASFSTIAPALAQDPDTIRTWTFHASKPESDACPGSHDSCNAWLKFRQTHPWPYQSYAVAKRADGYVVIISEPSSQLSRDNFDLLTKAAFGDRLKSAARYRWATGIDGWLEDVVLMIAPEPDGKTTKVLSPALTTWDAPAGLAETLRYIDTVMSDTSEGFWLENVDDAVSSAPIASLAVRPNEVAGWLKAGTWVPLSGEATSGSWTEMTSKQGTYRSADGALVALVIPRGTPLDATRADFRHFSLESDVLAAAVKPANGAFILLGRKRQEPLSTLPPLRFETFASLAARQSDELAQSYERQRVFAGKIRTGAFGGWDWAPILLSKQIEDSEFGTLLNQADQVLKSWSQAGQVRYLDFPVANPTTFPFEGPLSAVAESQLEASSIIFNWNTQDFSALTDQPAGRILTADRSGALPVLYLPSSNDEDGEAIGALTSAAWSNTGRTYFEQTGHPLVARVAQNTFLYQAVNNLLTSPAGPADTGQSRSQIATVAIQAEARNWLSGISSGAIPANPMSSEVQKEVRGLLATPGMTVDKAAELLATSQISASRLVKLHQRAMAAAELADDRVQEVRAQKTAYEAAFDLACAEAIKIGGRRTSDGCHVNSEPAKQVKFTALKSTAIAKGEKLQAAISVAEQAGAAAEAAAGDFKRETRNYETAQRLGRKIADSAWLTADLDGVKDRILIAASRDTSAGSIRTPTLVLSQNEVDVWAVGGHNVGGRPPIKKLVVAKPSPKTDGVVPPPRSATEALAVRGDAPKSMLDLVRTRPAIVPAQEQAARTRLQSCGGCRAVVERIGPDDFVVVKRPPLTGRFEVVHGASGLIDVLREARAGEMTHFYNVDARWAQALMESASVGNLAKGEPASLIERTKVLFGFGGKPPSPPHYAMELPGPGRRRTYSIFGDDMVQGTRVAKARPQWSLANVGEAVPQPRAWLESHPEIEALRGPRDTHPVVVVVSLPQTQPIRQLAVVMEMTQAEAASLAGGKLQTIVQKQIGLATPTVDVATMAVRTRDRIRQDLNPDDINFYVKDNLGDLRMALLER